MKNVVLMPERGIPPDSFPQTEGACGRAEYRQGTPVFLLTCRIVGQRPLGYRQRF